jgi:hypothetical protein
MRKNNANGTMNSQETDTAAGESSSVLSSANHGSCRASAALILALGLYMRSPWREWESAVGQNVTRYQLAQLHSMPLHLRGELDVHHGRLHGFHGSLVREAQHVVYLLELLAFQVAVAVRMKIKLVFAREELQHQASHRPQVHGRVVLCAFYRVEQTFRGQLRQEHEVKAHVPLRRGRGRGLPEVADLDDDVSAAAVGRHEDVRRVDGAVDYAALVHRLGPAQESPRALCGARRAPGRSPAGCSP